MAKVFMNGIQQVERPAFGFKKLARSYRAVKTGKNNLIVTLPREWCESNNVQAGSPLNLFIDGNVLVVQYE